MTGPENNNFSTTEMYIKREYSNVLEELLAENGEKETKEEEKEEFSVSIARSTRNINTQQTDKKLQLLTCETSTLTYGSDDVIDVDYLTENSMDLSSNDDDDLDNENYEDNQTEIYLQNFLRSIDLLVFDDFSQVDFPSKIVADLPEKLLEECSVWRQKFMIQKTKSNTATIHQNEDHRAYNITRIPKIRSHSSTTTTTPKLTSIVNPIQLPNKHSVSWKQTSNINDSLELSFPRLSISDNTYHNHHQNAPPVNLKPIRITRNTSFDEETRLRLRSQTYPSKSVQQQFAAIAANNNRFVTSNNNSNKNNLQVPNSNWHRFTLPPIVPTTQHSSKSQLNVPTTTVNSKRPSLALEWKTHITNDQEDEGNSDFDDPLLYLRKYSNSNSNHHHSNLGNQSHLIGSQRLSLLINHSNSNGNNRIDSSLPPNHYQSLTTLHHQKQSQYHVILRNKLFNNNNRISSNNSDSLSSVMVSASSISNSSSSVSTTISQSFRLPSIEL